MVNKFGQYYSLDRIIKSTKLEFINISFNQFIVKRGDELTYRYNITLDKDLFPICCCWWFIHRSMNNRDKFGLCVHQLGFLYRYNHSLFWAQFDDTSSKTL